MNPSINKIKEIVAGAIRMLEDGTWNPGLGGEYKNPHTYHHVIFHKTSRFCPKAGYTLIHPIYGKWSGYLNGSTFKKVGKPNQTMTVEQMQRAIDWKNNSEKKLFEALFPNQGEK